MVAGQKTLIQLSPFKDDFQKLQIMSCLNWAYANLDISDMDIWWIEKLLEKHVELKNLLKNFPKNVI